MEYSLTVVTDDLLPVLYYSVMCICGLTCEVDRPAAVWRYNCIHGIIHSLNL